MMKRPAGFLACCLILFWYGLLTGCFIPVIIESPEATASARREPPSFEPIPGEGPCILEAIARLEEHDPVGTAVYRNIGRKEFIRWIDCKYQLMDQVFTAVHECTHLLSGHCARTKVGDYPFFLPLGELRVLQSHDLYPRKNVALYLEPEQKGVHYEIYLTGKSGEVDILNLLNELNAYTCGLLSACNLQQFTHSALGARAGLPAFMHYLELYLRHGRIKEKQDYLTIKNDREYLMLIKTLWENAEDALIKAHPYPRFDVWAWPWWERVYDPDNLNELRMLYAGTDLEIHFNGTIHILIEQQ